MFRCLPGLVDFSMSTYAKSRDPLLFIGSNDADSDSSDGAKTNERSVKQQSLHKRPSNQERRRKSAVGTILKLNPTSGALQLPCYKTTPRDTCPLLRHCWSQNWEKVVEICVLEPHRALHKTDHTGRTALHLATFSRQCPLHVAQALLTANRHMILMQDATWYTPLHIMAVFNNSSENVLQEEENNLMTLFCTTAVMVEQELQDNSLVPPAYGTSPLFLAAKRNAPLSILSTLLQTRNRTSWIAPSTGGEPYWDCNTLDEYSSPLEVLLRDSNRGTYELNPDELRHDPKLIQKLRRVALRRLSRKPTAPGEKSSNALHAKVVLWEKCIELLVGHCPLLEVGDDASHIPYGVLHAVTCCKVPVPSLVKVALILFPEQAWQRDEQGMIPLHHVLRYNHKYSTSALLDILLPPPDSGCMGANLRSTALVCFPNNGPTPLAYALKQGLPMSPVIERLLEADSDSTLRVMDPSSGLYPFCLVALPVRDDKKEEEVDQEQQGFMTETFNQSGYESCRSTSSLTLLEQVDLTYRLLLAHPDILAYCSMP
jgi:hypothetical protein